jgi:hypothetical protein
MAYVAWLVITWCGLRGYCSAPWEDSAMSRDLNDDCILLDFFDSHDVWHLLSGFALYYLCYGVVALDDDLLDTQRDNIAVF